MSARVSHEALILAKLRTSLVDLPGVEYASGMGASNRFPLEGWQLVGSQQFQFGDMRIETASTTIVVEAESGGGVTNLAKYWPYLAARPKKRFVLAHLFQVLSANDYISHIRLWDFLIERMQTDLEGRFGMCRPEHWETRSFRYGPQLDSTPEIVAYLRAAAT